MEKMINVDGTTDTLTVKNLKIGDGSAKTWTINTNDHGSLMFNTDNTHKWIDFNSNLHMVGNKEIMFNNYKWRIFVDNFFNRLNFLSYKANDYRKRYAFSPSEFQYQVCNLNDNVTDIYNQDSVVGGCHG